MQHMFFNKILSYIKIQSPHPLAPFASTPFYIE